MISVLPTSIDTRVYTRWSFCILNCPQYGQVTEKPGSKVNLRGSNGQKPASLAYTKSTFSCKPIRSIVDRYTAHYFSVEVNIGTQRRSQVSLAGGVCDRIPGGGGVNLNTYSYGKRDNAIISPHDKLNSYVCSKGKIMCVFCKVLLIPNFNFLREKYGDTLMKNAIFRRFPTSSAIPICLPMCKSFRIAVIFRKPLNLTQPKKCQGSLRGGSNFSRGGLSPLVPPPWLRVCRGFNIIRDAWGGANANC